MKNVLILGASGFLGGQLVAQIRAEGRENLCVPIRSKWDLQDRDSLVQLIKEIRPDIVLNLAAISSLLADQGDLYAINARGPLNLMESLIECGFAGRFIQFSSSNVYGGLQEPVITEDMRPLPLNHYSCAKLLAEHYCSLFSDRIEAVIVRPFSIIGVKQKPNFLLPKLADHFARKATEIALGNTKIARDFVDSRDFVSMVITLIRAPETPPILNLSNGATVSLDRILSAFQRISGHTPEIKVNQAFIRDRDITFQCGDNSRIVALGYEQQYTIDDTVRWIYGEYVQKGCEQ